MAELVLCENHDRVAVLTLNRPEKLNALNYALIDRLLEMLDRIETDDAVRAVILTGAGERAFSAGADIHEFSVSVAAGADAALRDFVMRGQRLTARLEAFRKPVIAAVNGIAFGGGCEIAESVPLAIASDRALFAKPEINLAMPPTFGGTQRLPRLAGRKRALELLLTGESFSAERAVELGLVNRIVPHAELMPAARDLARRILSHSATAVAGILTAVARGINLGIAEGLLVEAEQFARLVPTADLREGLDAWMERRKPAFGGSWMHITRPSEARRASVAMDRAAAQGETATRPRMLG
ncbi:crotonase/enoyl-CoA hydratase family protein [Mesorhizobium abyssinicae]|uniref:Crotonase/enoyl-CoA hydratase family protein n=1 Tax=Mesorhizobium abyssinicae TaxID=1209958 RepID=A0ABU5AUS2_9HYPH|nr:crotonase/enoyl-CoA hydratase family protein [Mesorhizobium abyssinicae]MDX8541028.1 crotonase/enoyl-CoA hydratase family protein [Mesorhizobium abyssinicae]